MKKMIALFLSFIVLTTMMSVSVFATNETYTEGLVFQKTGNGNTGEIYYCIKSYNGTEDDVVVPDYYNGYPVTRISSNAFSGSNIKSIKLPSQLREIESSAFSGCSNLASIIIPDNVTNISAFAFSSCASLTHITFPVNETSIDWGAFFNCTSLTSITLPNTVTSIGDSAFSECTSLTSVTIGNGVTSIGDSAFSNCISLSSITIPDNVTTLGDSVFENCTNLTSAIIGNGVESIGARAFYNCYRFTSVTIGNGVKSIGERAFYYCTSLTSITIPDGVTSIGSYAFEDCANLTSITIPDSLISIGSWAFYDCTSLSEVITPCNSYASTHFKESILVLTHTSSSDWVVDENATCTEDGTKHCACVACGELITEVIPATGHVLSDWIVDREETCTVSGKKHKECTDCGVTLENELISATGHVASDWIVDRNASCTASGTKHKECTVCGAWLGTEPLPPTGVHTSSDWIVDTLATVSAPGSKHKECTACGEILETVAIAQLKPATPKVATTNEIGGVNITWNAVDGAVKYQIYRRQGGYSTWTLVGTTTGTSLLDKNVQSGIYYVYSVRAYNNAGQYSDFVSANTQTRKFMAVPKLKGISNATNGLYITWEPVAGITNGYRVYRRGAGSTYWTYLGTTKNTYFTDTAVKNNSGEYFRYTVIADGGYHSKFDTTGLYLRRLSNPTLKSATSASAGITVKWTPVNGCLGYYVYRKTADSNWVRVGVVNGVNSSSYLDKTAKKGVTYTYTVRAVCGSYISYFNSGISCKDKY